MKIIQNNQKIPIPTTKYKCLVVDPPWNQGKTGVRSVRKQQTQSLDYPTMNYNEIKELNIGDWACAQSFIWLWATNSKEKSSKTPILKLAFDLLEAWGFNYYTTITWDKKTGVCPFGPYQIVTEHVLFGYKGKFEFERKGLGKTKNLFCAASKGHSRKPDELYEHIERWFARPPNRHICQS